MGDFERYSVQYTISNAKMCYTNHRQEAYDAVAYELYEFLRPWVKTNTEITTREENTEYELTFDIRPVFKKKEDEAPFFFKIEK